MESNVRILENITEFTEVQITQFNRLQQLKYLEQEPRGEEEDAPILSPSDKDESPTTFVVSIATDEQSDKILGYSLLLYQNPNSEIPSFPPGMGFGEGFVDPSTRSNGIGNQLFAKLLDHAGELNITKLFFNTSTEGGKNFLTKKGGIIQSQHAEQRLYFEDIDKDLLKDWADNELPEGYKLEFIETMPDEDMEQYCKVYNYLTNNQTRDRNEPDAMVKTPEKRRMEERVVEENDHDWITLVVRNREDKIIGLTEVYYQPQEKKSIRQNLTGILPEERGQGMGKVIKAKIYQKALDKHPNVEFITTTNDKTNAAMRSINEKLGFKLYKEVQAIVLNLDA